MEDVNVVAQHAGTPQHAPILLSGIVPPLADPYYTRPETGPADLQASLHPGQTTILTHGQQSAVAPGMQGGTGKTQLAIDFSHSLWTNRAVEVLAWVTAANRESIITSFAQAASAVGAGDPDDNAEVAATRFVTWLAHTRRPWLVILDDLTAASDLDGLWPFGPAGQALVTTRLPAMAFGGTGTPVPDARVVPVDGFSRREALAYLNATAHLLSRPADRGA